MIGGLTHPEPVLALEVKAFVLSLKEKFSTAAVSFPTLPCCQHLHQDYTFLILYCTGNPAVITRATQQQVLCNLVSLVRDFNHHLVAFHTSAAPQLPVLPSVWLRVQFSSLQPWLQPCCLQDTTPPSMNAG